VQLHQGADTQALPAAAACSTAGRACGRSPDRACRYIHTTVDGPLQDAGGHHNSALFVQWVRLHACRQVNTIYQFAAVSVEE